MFASEKSGPFEPPFVMTRKTNEYKTIKKSRDCRASLAMTRFAHFDKHLATHFNANSTKL